jgi:glycosyltransferase involved in cell wall biosynthesis
LHAKLNLLLIGRFNSWKGQDVLIRAAAHLPPELRARVNIRLVGSVFDNQSHFTDRLAQLIEQNDLSEVVEILPFSQDPYPHYCWADAVVVPSINPEPFGLVAIEAMAAGRSVIAANHGGLPEIVVDGVTGTLVAPNSIESLAAAIAGYIEDPGRAAAQGIAGRNRFVAEFDESRFKLRIVNTIAGLADPNPA